jgi:hypothetical protein
MFSVILPTAYLAGGAGAVAAGHWLPGAVVGLTGALVAWQRRPSREGRARA